LSELTATLSETGIENKTALPSSTTAEGATTGAVTEEELPII